MQTNTLQKTVSQGLKKARQQTENDRRRTVQQTVRGGGAKAVYTALNTAQKAQFAQELEDYYRKSQQKSGDLAKQTAARKSNIRSNTSIHYTGEHAFGGSSGSFGEASLYAQRRQQKDEARETIRERWLDYLGTAATQAQLASTGYVSPDLQLSLSRRQADNAQAIREARAKFDEANRTIDWDGRSELTSALEELDRRSGWEISEEQANEIERERQKLLARLRAGDYRAGNGIRSGTDADTGRDVVGSTAKGIAGSGVNLVSNLGKNLERIDAYFPKPLDTISDLINGQEWGATRRQRIDAYEDPASQEKWKQIDAIADQLDYGAAQLLQRAKEGKSLAGEFGVDVTKNALEMSFDAGVALATGGSALVPMGARVYGQSVGTARRAGATLEQQTAYALTNTAIEVSSERLFDGVAGIYGAGAADEITEELVRRLADTDAGRTLLRTVIGAAGEGTEEVVSDLLSPIAEAMVRDESVAELYRQLDPADVLYDYMIGFAMGTFGAGADIATGQNAEANAELKACDANEAAYLRRMEEIGYLPAESSKNAARDGAAEELASSTSEGSTIESDFPVEEPLFETDEYAYDLWSKSIGLNDTVKTLAEYLDIKYNNPPRYKLIKRYAEDVDSGWISPLCSFENYERLYNRTQNEIVGLLTSNGIKITGQSHHFLQRVIGTSADPSFYMEWHRLAPRSGVELNDIIDALLNGVPRQVKYGKNGASQLYISKKCKVSINPESGTLIQCSQTEE